MTPHLATLSNLRILLLVPLLSLAIFMSVPLLHIPVPLHPCLTLVTQDSLPDPQLAMSSVDPAQSSRSLICPTICGLDSCSASLLGRLEQPSQFHSCPHHFCVCGSVMHFFLSRIELPTSFS